MGWDSNPRDAQHACRFSRPVPSTARPPIHVPKRRHITGVQIREGAESVNRRNRPACRSAAGHRLPGRRIFRTMAALPPTAPGDNAFAPAVPPANKPDPVARGGGRYERFSRRPGNPGQTGTIGRLSVFPRSFRNKFPAADAAVVDDQTDDRTAGLRGDPGRPDFRRGARYRQQTRGEPARLRRRTEERPALPDERPDAGFDRPFRQRCNGRPWRSGYRAARKPLPRP